MGKRPSSKFLLILATLAVVVFLCRSGYQLVMQTYMIPHMEAEKDVKGLTRALSLGFAKAGRALGNIGGDEAASALVQALRYRGWGFLGDKDIHIRFTAAMELGNMKHPKNVEALIETLKDPEALVRREAALSLGKIGDPRAIGPLTQTLHDEDVYVREKAEETLEKLKERSR